MKKYFKFKLLLALMGTSSLSFGQCPNIPECSLNTNLLNGDYKARDEVKAIDGAQAHPTNYTRLFIDKTIQVNETYESSVNYSDNQVNSPVDYNLPVGAIQGKSDVTSNGQASYDISIAVPPGTRNLAPDLGISYNSGKIDGILGRGWDIRGLSSISRVTKDLYHDGIIKGIQLDNTDVFNLDGVRIIGSHLENDNFSNITFSGGYFTVETKQGLIMEYGNNSDSKLMVYSSILGGMVPMTWYLSKVKDKYDNNISYLYYNQNNEVAIKEIQYLGNPPYNFVKFYYDIRRDKTKHDLPWNELSNTLLLREIEIDCEGNFMKSYQFKYGFNSQTFLNEITERNSDFSKLNSTFIKYGNNVTTPNNILVVNVNNLITNADYRTGDFNGDGRADLVAFEYNSIISGSGHKSYSGNWKLYLNNGGSSFLESTPTPVLPNPFQPYLYVNVIGILAETGQQLGLEVYDFNGDGKDDILIGNSTTQNSEIAVYYSTGSDFIKETNSSKIFNFSNSSNVNLDFFLADIDGDGILEGTAYFSDVTTGTESFEIFNFRTGQTSDFNNFTYLVNPASGTFYGGINQFIGSIGGFNLQSKGFAAIDYDGDGKQELITVRENRMVILSLANNTCTEKYYEILGTDYIHNYFGDFNGDAISDNVQISDPYILSNPDAQIRFGTGAYFEYPSFMNGTTHFSQSRIHLVCDINNDGKSDLIKLESSGLISVSYGGQEASPMTILGNNSAINFPPVVDYDYNKSGYNPNYPNFFYHNTIPNQEPEFLRGDFDGDGRDDIFFKTANSGQRAIVYINQGSTQHLVTAISDGFRRKTIFNYSTLANGGSSVYVKATGAPYPVVDTQVPIYVVTETSVPDGIGGINTSTYKYEGATVHLIEKKFLGFNKFILTNNSSNIQTEHTFNLNTSFYENVPSQTKTFLLPDLLNPIAEETYSTDFVSTSTNWRTHFVKTTNVLSQDHLSGKTITKDLTYDDVNGNVTMSSVDINGIETTIVNTTYEHAGSWGAILNVPSIVITTTTRSGIMGSNIRQVNYSHDNVTGVLTQTVQDPATSNELVTENVYNPLTGVLTETHISAPACLLTCPDKNSSYEYDNNSRFVTKEHNPLGQITETSYDPKWGTPLTVKGIDGLFTRYAYDGLGRQIKITTPDNLTAKTNYEWVQSPPVAPDPLGVLSYALYSVLVTRPGSPATKSYFDNIDREILSEKDGFLSVKTYKEKKYDARGNLISETSGYQQGSTPLITTHTYDDSEGPNLLRQNITTDNATHTNITGIDYTYTGGNITVTTTAPDGNISSKTTDATGRLSAAADNGGAIAYEYVNDIFTQEIKINGLTANTIVFDGFGHQTSLFDKDAKLNTYTYDAYNQLTSQTDARGNIYNTFIYDELGRITQKIGSEGTYLYSYIPQGTNGANQISEIKIIAPTNHIKYSYTYDGLNRITAYTEENIAGLPPLTTSYTYDTYSNLVKTTYPGGFATANEYDVFGYLTKIKNASSGNIIWQADDMNALDKYSKWTLGNGTQTNITYNTFGFPEDIAAGNIQHLQMVFDLNNGNLNSKKDFLANGGNGLTETFNYDNNRLTAVLGPSPMTIAYNANGTISQKSDAGDYLVYDSNHPDGVFKLTNPAGNINTASPQNISYNTFNKTAVITEGDYSLNIIYGPDQQRKITELSYQGNVTSTRYFYPQYEKTVAGTATTSEVYYINSPIGLCAMYVVENGVGNMYYVYTDHLGSILKLTDQSGNVATDQLGNLAEQSFDSWGRNRRPDNWSYNNIPVVPAWLYRGFTGHEHLPNFALINMNGRNYDPILGMMLSPDNNVSDVTNTKCFNRYSYARNNPLSYTDPSGESENWCTIWGYETFGQIFDQIRDGWVENPMDGSFYWVPDPSQGYAVADWWEGNTYIWGDITGGKTFTDFSSIPTLTFNGLENNSLLFTYKTWHENAPFLDQAMNTLSVAGSNFNEGITSFINNIADGNFGKVAQALTANGPGGIIAPPEFAPAELAVPITEMSGRAFFSGIGMEAKAIEQGYQTLNQTRAGKNLQKLIESKNIPWKGAGQAEEMWKRLSTVWTKGITKGSNVPVFLNNPRADAIWYQTELPILQLNKVNIINK